MLRKSLFFLFLMLIVAIVACDDNELIKPKDSTSVSPPPALRTININVRKSATSWQDADVYYQLNYGSWFYIGTITNNTGCVSKDSFQAYDGDVLYLSVVESDGSAVSFRAAQNDNCPTSGTTYCGNLIGGSTFSHTVSANVTFSISALVRSDIPHLQNCVPPVDPE